MTPSLRNQSSYCEQCDILHRFSPGQCRSIRHHGPRNIEQLHIDRSWSTDIEAIVVGTMELIHLPVSLKKRVLNLGTTTRPLYSVPASINHMDQVIVSPDSLHAYLQTVVNLIGLERNLPIYVEFYPAIHMDSDPILCHILGFLKVIKVVQEQYKGPLVVIVAPVSPIEGATQHDYIKAKLQNASLQVMVYLLGYGYGVPVLMTPMYQVCLLYTSPSPRD